MLAETLVALRAAALGYGAQPVLTDVDLELASGEVLGLVGPNGAGKTTLLRGLLGLIEPLAGRREGDPRAGYVTQHERLDALYPLTVFELVAQGGLTPRGALRRPAPAEPAAVERALERVGLAQRRAMPFHQLSGGQLQRALVARALVAEPRLVALDEPTSGVDPDAADRVLVLVREVVEETGCAAVIVSHDLVRLSTSVDRVAVVRAGRVELLGAGSLDPVRLLNAMAPAGTPGP